MLIQTLTYFLAGFFLVAGFLAAGFFTAGFFTAGFLTAGFLAAGRLGLPPAIADSAIISDVWSTNRSKLIDYYILCEHRKKFYNINSCLKLNLKIYKYITN